MRFLIPLASLAALFVAWWAVAHRGPAPLVVYCAHDSIYSEKILHDFEKLTGIPVAIRFDTEATKSLGLVELLVQEKGSPRCDVFWNNELLGTMDLAERGILDPYKGPGWQRIPEKFRDPDGRWTGFAARMRAVVYNTDSAKRNFGKIPHDLKRWAIAKPLYGTTLTHYSALWHTLGAEGLKTWHREWRNGGVVELNGNAAVTAAIAQGICDTGFTDTDDVFAAEDNGQPVSFYPVTLDTGETIVIPNTIAVIRGTKHGTQARQLVDFLLSEETEIALARSKSRQIPLGPVAAKYLPHDTRGPSDTPRLSVPGPEAADYLSSDVRWMIDSARRGVDLTKLGPARAECLAWLKSEYLK